MSLHLYSQLHAGINRLTVHKHRAGAAGRSIADFLCAREPKPIPQDIKKSDPRFNFHFVPVPVNLQDHFYRLGSERFLAV